jgi:hypothetical protein
MMAPRFPLPDERHETEVSSLTAAVVLAVGQLPNLVGLMQVHRPCPCGVYGFGHGCAYEVLENRYKALSDALVECQ